MVNQWKDIKEGFGLEEVPKELRRDFACEILGPHSPNEKLYTNQPLPTSSTAAAYKKELDAIRRNVWCRYHATWLFKERT